MGFVILSRIFIPFLRKLTVCIIFRNRTVANRDYQAVNWIGIQGIQSCVLAILTVIYGQLGQNQWWVASICAIHETG